ncbi:Protein P [Labeo rohita]|uniref:Protein P n=1 Tax=Labeo rohita TaxID=84645 RepID=A0ABQ8LN60_LABRO|nr:Protein P [Labeo rohita]
MVSPQCPHEISLFTLPSPVCQGTAVSSKRISQHPFEFSSASGHRASHSKNTRDQSREADSVSRTSGSVEASAKHISVGPAYCRERLQNSVRLSAASFNGVLPTLVGPKQALVMEQEVNTLLRKEAIEVVPPHDRESGFYSRYASQVQDAYSQAGRVTDQVRGHMKELGLRLNAKKSVLSPVQRTTYLGVVWDLTTMQARLSPARIESILTSVKRVKIGRPERPSCAGAHRQHSGGLLHQSPGRSAVTAPEQAGTPDPLVGPGETPLAQSSSYPWASQSGSRRPVETGAKAWGMETPPRGGGAHLDPVWSSSSGSICDSGDFAMSPLDLSESSSSPETGCHGTDVAEASSVRISPDRSAPGSSGESAPGRHFTNVSSPVLARPSIVLGPDFSPLRPSFGNSSQEGSPLTGSVLEFLQARFASGLTYSTLKVYVAAISAFHVPLSTPSLGRHPLVSRFLRGVLRLRPPVCSCVPTYDLAVVLEALCKPPFEHLEEISDRFLSLKTAFLLAISSLKRVTDLQALSVAPSFLDFAPSMAKEFLHPKPGYVPKVPSSVSRPSCWRLSVLLLTVKFLLFWLSECVQCEHWMHTSTELPCGGRQTNCLCVLVPLTRVNLPLSRPSVDHGCHHL